MKHLARGEIPPELIRKLMDSAIGKFIRGLCEHVNNNHLSVRVIKKARGKRNGFIKRVLDGDMLCDVSVGKLSDVFTGLVYDITRKLDKLQRNDDKTISERERNRQITYLRHELDSLINPFFNIIKNFVRCFAGNDHIRELIRANIKEILEILDEEEKTKK